MFRRKNRISNREEFFVDEKSLRSLSELTASDNNTHYWNSFHTQITVTVSSLPQNDNTMLGGSIRLMAKVDNGSYEFLGSSESIPLDDVTDPVTGRVDTELKDSIKFIKSKFNKKIPKILYGGSVSPKNINNLKMIKDLDGFLIGGASQNSKNFIDIVKKTYN